MYQYKLLSVSVSGNNGKFHLPCSVHFLIIGSSYVDGQDKPLLLHTDQKCKHLTLPTTTDFRIDSEYYLKRAERAMCDEEHYCPLVSKPQKLSYNSVLLFVFLEKKVSSSLHKLFWKKEKRKKDRQNKIKIKKVQ